MALKFYKKEAPANNPVIGNGASIIFTTLDRVTGYYATDNAYVQQEFEQLMRSGRYGISEIDAVEFTRDYVEKKNQPKNRGRPWREELSQSGLNQSVVPSPAPSAPQAVAAVEATQPVLTTTTPPVPPALPGVKVNFQPPKGTRKKGSPKGLG